MSARGRTDFAQRGQGTIEWIGALLVVAALLAVVLAVIPTTEPMVKKDTICLVQRVLHLSTSCSTTNLPPNEVVCATSTDTKDASDQVSVLFINVGNDHTLIKTTYSNGQVSYTLVNAGSAELQATLFRAEAEAGGAGFDVNVTAAAGGLLQGSRTWTFPNAAAAAAFAKQVNGQGGSGETIHDIAGLLGGPIGSGVADLFGAHGAPNTSGLDPKNVTFSYSAAGVEGNLKAGANFGLGSVANGTLDAQLQGAAGVRVVTSSTPTSATSMSAGSNGAVQKGDYQYFINLNGSANASLAAELLGRDGSGEDGTGENAGDGNVSAGAAASGTAQGTAVVTVSPSGQLVQLQIVANAQYTAGASVSGKAGSGEGTTPGEDGEVSKALDISQNDGQGLGYQYSGTLNLQNDPAAKTALLQMLTGNTGPATQTLMQQMGSNGTQRIQPYTVSRSQGTTGLQLEAVDVGGGVQASTSDNNQSFSPGSIKTPGGTWEKVVCEK